SSGCCRHRPCSSSAPSTNRRPASRGSSTRSASDRHPAKETPRPPDGEVAHETTPAGEKGDSMDVTREQVKDYLKNMSLMDAATLVKELETELGVSAAAPMAVAAAGPAAGGGAAAAAPEKEDFTV